MKIAVIGSGISGLATAYLAQHNGAEVHLFEKANYFGGHSNTIEISDGHSKFFADTGFLVFNPRTYPNLIELIKILNVKAIDSQMTLSIQDLDKKIEWGGTNLGTVFSQKSNIFRPSFYRMLFDIIRFNKEAAGYLVQLKNNREQTLRELIKENNYSSELCDWYLVPMAAAIWSTPANRILDFPAFTFIQFCLNHNLFQVNDRPIWKTIDGGSREYVKKITDQIKNKYLNAQIKNVVRENNQVVLIFENEKMIFDKVIFATHADTALELQAGIGIEEASILSQFRYQKNRAVVHSDINVLPKRKNLWSSWNYSTSRDANQVSVSYMINYLQNLPTEKPIIVTLNPNQKLDPTKIIREIDYEHPVFDVPTIEAQEKILALQGKDQIYYTGAWLGYGFHEDGLKSALRVARLLKWNIPWNAIYE